MTTVTISDDTHRKLKKLKEDRGADSFDRLLSEIADEELEVPTAEEVLGSAEVEDRESIRERSDRSERY